MQLSLEGIHCPDCRTELGFSGIYVVSDGDTLVCTFCASDRARAGESGLRCLRNPGPRANTARRSGFDGEGEPLTDHEGAALLLRHGAKISGRYWDPERGRYLSGGEGEAALMLELGEG